MFQPSIVKGGMYWTRNQESGRVPAMSQMSYSSKVVEESLKMEQLTKGYTGCSKTNKRQWDAEGASVAISRHHHHHPHHYSCWRNNYLNLTSPQMVSLDAISLWQSPTGNLRTSSLVHTVHTGQPPMAESSVVMDGEKLPGREHNLPYQILPQVKSWGPGPFLPSLN